jgi:hypothetical protein
MDLIVVIAAFPIGWLVRHRLTAFVVYLAGFNFLFTFQSIKLITEWAGGSKAAFGPFPKANSGDAWSYGVVNLIFLAVGLGLLVAGRFAGARLRARRTDPTLGDRLPA